MNPLEIALLIIGIVIIVISLRLIDRSQKAASQTVSTPFSYEKSLTEEDKSKLLDKMKELLSDLSEEMIVRTDDSLSKLSNEKIMAVNEFSDQILEKIKRNHEEVVFLYNMLNDKEKELKAAVKEIDTSKKKVQDILEVKAEEAKVQAAKVLRTQAAGKTQIAAPAPDKANVAGKPMADNTVDRPVLNGLNTNNNSQILALYSQGKTVMEISKLLGLGQGEVKLVIDLFKGKK